MYHEHNPPDNENNRIEREEDKNEKRKCTSLVNHLLIVLSIPLHNLPNFRSPLRPVLIGIGRLLKGNLRLPGHRIGRNLRVNTLLGYFGLERIERCFDSFGLRSRYGGLAQQWLWLLFS